MGDSDPKEIDAVDSDMVTIFMEDGALFSLSSNKQLNQ
jgi:hypothetical protein